MLHLSALLAVHCFVILFPLWDALPFSLLSSNNHTTSLLPTVFSRSPPVLYFPPYDILAFHTSHTPSMTLLFSWYTTSTLIGIPCQEYSSHSAPVLFVVRHVPDSSSISFAVPFMAWPHMLPPLLLASSFPFPKENTYYTCVSSLHI